MDSLEFGEQMIEFLKLNCLFTLSTLQLNDLDMQGCEDFEA